MFNNVEAANKAARIAIGIIVFAFAMIYHRYETQQWPFDHEKVRAELAQTQSDLKGAVSQIQADQVAKAKLQADLAVKQAEINRVQVSLMLADTMQYIVNANAVMAKELELVKAHSAEVVGLVKAQKAELVKTVDGIYSADDVRDHQLARDLIGVSKEYAKQSADLGCCGMTKTEQKPVTNRFFFEFRPSVDTTFQVSGQVSGN